MQFFSRAFLHVCTRIMYLAFLVKCRGIPMQLQFWRWVLVVLSLHCSTLVNPNRCAGNLLQEVPKKRTEEGYVDEAFRANFEYCHSDRPWLEKEQRRTSRSIRRILLRNDKQRPSTAEHRSVGEDVQGQDHRNTGKRCRHLQNPPEQVRLSFDWLVQHTETVRRRTVRRCFRFWVARYRQVTYYIIGLLKQLKASMSTEWIQRKMRPIMGGLVAKKLHGDCHVWKC